MKNNNDLYSILDNIDDNIYNNKEDIMDIYEKIEKSEPFIKEKSSINMSSHQDFVFDEYKNNERRLYKKGDKTEVLSKNKKVAFI